MPHINVIEYVIVSKIHLTQQYTTLQLRESKYHNGKT